MNPAALYKYSRLGSTSILNSTAITSFRAQALKRIGNNSNRLVVRHSGSYHFENVNGSHLPFRTDSKLRLAINMVLFLSLGFEIPFIAAIWQFHKAGKPLFHLGPPIES
ncbi:12285_t:CDS:2 [Ambispora leptoticha]|uniref:12285_t:CDS:1 n=1 Tax=Ambispora leptoticha TaxID=144679 RepID=A0A9N9FRE6_9GLOM|nr:12285_t:CDS:2 [Ambispora leptoticha]